MLSTAVLAALAAAAAYRPALHAYRYTRAGAARRHYRPMLWHAYRWRWLARAAYLAYVDQHHRRRYWWLPLAPWRSSVEVAPAPVHRVRWPRARFRVAEHGWTADVRTIPRVGREELAKAAPWLADSWRCHRVTVTQTAPGRVQLHGLRVDPLAAAYPAAACPPGTFDTDTFPPRLLLGRDETGAWRHLELPNVTGITATGLPGAGKSTALASWLCQLSGSPAVQPLILDGKGSTEWADWAGRALVLDDDTATAEDALTAELAELRRRMAVVASLTGHRNAWHRGPTPELPLRLVVLDECQTYLDVTARKGDRQAEDRARRTGQLVSTLVRKGRSVLYLVILATQQGTVDAFGSSQLRNNCALSVAFGLRTVEAAVAALGDDIRRYPDLSPTLHQGQGLAGLCTATLRTGLDPYTRIRCPELTEAAAAARATATARHSRPLPHPGLTVVAS
jgi:DNA segregation ATPase FtsK/SpoIIIE, S-DNA-T family